MKHLGTLEFLSEAGVQVPERDMSAYDGKSFDCSCGEQHEFASYMDYRNFATSGANAKMMVTCPIDPQYSTLIKTKYKFFVVFDRFVSLAGHKAS